jgi:hypothetical protein
MTERKEAVRTASALTSADFAQKCAYIAARAARYAGDTLELPEWRDKQAPPVAVARFIRDIRGILDTLEPHTGRSRPLGEGG